jgi:hypothetical protein
VSEPDDFIVFTHHALLIVEERYGSRKLRA